ncbi:hypothetical protein CQA49_08105 [Helicobacter sp. MIT 00-7814]|uniref:hypothetical protein n=1 Tax=unclassified Helicobacter TaxID=2593540 RepID=UPI000E1EDDC0|nr:MULTISPECIES: hypothetical protein [unclassified Helicobacter]RDU51716.1 hypothetical protein CQA37_09380 [Helicobacter sp. MIT 99-10781]RDU52568.1 hypothetical protein CQA49_08105 [Helicobacter sp. MIT 00-7814]
MNAQILTTKSGLKYLQPDILNQHIPYTTQEVKEFFTSFAKEKNMQGKLTLWLNSASKMLDLEGDFCILNDYVAKVGDGNDFLCNLGCCFFDIKDIQGYDEAQVLNAVKEICFDAYNAQPLIMKAYAKRCYQKKQEALKIRADNLLGVKQESL